MAKRLYVVQVVVVLMCVWLGALFAWATSQTANRHAGLNLTPTARTQAAVSPGIVICGGALGGTTWDHQSYDDNQRMIALSGLPGDPYVHFAWNYWDKVPDPLDQIDRFVAVNCWSQSGGLGLGNCGILLNSMEGDRLRAKAGYPTIDVSSSSLPHIAFYARGVDQQPLGESGLFSTWVFNAGAQCFNIFGEEQFHASEQPEAIWPHIAIDHNTTPSTDVFHLVSLSTGENTPTPPSIFYWRRVGGHGNAWEGPVVLDHTVDAFSHHVAVDPTTDRVAVFYMRDDLEANRHLQGGYLESFDNGANWIARGGFPTPIEFAEGPYVSFTSYTGPKGTSRQAWVECSGEYDWNGIKHAVWIEQIYSDASPDCRVMHWDQNNGVRTVRQALGWNNIGVHGSRDLWLALPNIAFGDGSTVCTDGPGDQTNLDYVYVTYEQYGGPTNAEATDVSASANQQNLDIYLAVSNDGGASFAPSVNLTNTKSPGCDGSVPGNECASERDPSLAKIVNDTIHIMYILDTDAGDAVFGEGHWTFNPVMYYRIPGGTDAEYLCPEIAPVFAARLTNGDADCEYHAALNASAGSQQQVEDLIIDNFGNAPLSGTVSLNPSVDWLVVATGAYSLPPGSLSDIRTVVLDATAASVQTGGEGLYQASIELTHNDTAQVSPYAIPVDFFVYDQFICPEYLTLTTGWLWLTVSNVERQGVQSEIAGGLSRLDPVSGDTSYSIFDASLVIGIPPSPDTVVFRSVYGEGAGQPGFRALGHLDVDTSAYGTKTLMATARAVQTTIDSTLDIQVEYQFPQEPDSCEFVLIKYRIANRTSGPLNDLVIGQATDFDVVPSTHDVDSLQIGTQNTGHLREDFNLIYQQGADTAGHVIVGDRTATRFKGGITAIQNTAAPRAWIAPSEPWLVENSVQGFRDGYLYREMTKTKFEVFPPNSPDPAEDLHAVMVMEQNLNLGSDDVRYYAVAYVSSNTGTDDADLIATTRKAWRYAFGWEEFTAYDSMPNPAASRSYRYHATGTHEDGVAGGCSGCLVTKTDDPGAAFSVVPGADPCYGTIEFNGGGSDTAFEATFRVTDVCSTYTEEFRLRVAVGSPPICACPHIGDFDDNGQLNISDLNSLIGVLFHNEFDPRGPDCPITKGDINGDGQVNSVDLNIFIKTLFFNGISPCDPCFPFLTLCGFGTG